MYGFPRLSSKSFAAAVALVLMVSIAAFAFFMPFEAQAEDNTAPDWSEGQETAMGVELDFLELYDSYSDEVDENMTYVFGDIEDLTYEDFAMNEGSIKSYLLLEVSEETEETVTVTQKMGFEIKTAFTLSAEMHNMTPAGEYADNETAEAEDKVDLDNSVSMSTTLAVVQSLSATFDKDTMDLISISTYVRSTSIFDLSVDKWPDMNDEGEEHIVTYGGFNVYSKTDVKVSSEVEFEPAFKMFDLPIDVGDEWNTTTEEITVSGGLDGTIDLQVTGTSPAVDEANQEIDYMFENITAEMPNATGIDGFPIKLDEVTIPAEYFDANDDVDDVPEFSIEEGQFPTESIEIPVVDLVCTENTTSDIMEKHNLTDGDVNIYWILPEGMPAPGYVDVSNHVPLHDDYTMMYVGGIPYVRALGDITMWETVMEEGTEEMESTMINMADQMGVNISESFSFSSMDVASANEGIESISDTQDEMVAEEDDTIGGIVDFFLEPPYLGSIAAVVLIILIGLMAARRG